MHIIILKKMLQGATYTDEVKKVTPVPRTKYCFLSFWFVQLRKEKTSLTIHLANVSGGCLTGFVMK